MHPFNADFYGHEMKAIVLGYIRPEFDYTSRGAYQRWFPNYDPFLARPPFSPHFPLPIDHPLSTLAQFRFLQRASLRILRPISASRSSPSCGQPIKSSRMTNILILPPPPARFALEQDIPSLFGLRMPSATSVSIPLPVCVIASWRIDRGINRRGTSLFTRRACLVLSALRNDRSPFASIAK